MQHPDFDNIDFKPEIAIYDWDQTYDVVQLPHLISGLIDFSTKNIRGIPLWEVMLFDRYSPENYPYAEEYDTKLFNLLKQYNYTVYNQLNALSFGTSLRAVRSSETIEVTDRQENDKYVISMLVATEIKLESYEDQGEDSNLVGSGYYNNYQKYPYLVINKVYHTWDGSLIDVIKLIEKKHLEDFSSSFFVRNSIVVNKINTNKTYTLVDIPDPRGSLMYSNLDASLNDLNTIITNAIDANNIPLGHYVSGNTQTFTIAKQSERASLDVVGIPRYTTNYYVSNSTGSFTTTPIQEFLRNYCFLSYANNNRWLNQEDKTNDLGYVYPVKKVVNNSIYYEFTIALNEKYNDSEISSDIDNLRDRFTPVWEDSEQDWSIVINEFTSIENRSIFNVPSSMSGELNTPVENNNFLIIPDNNIINNTTGQYDIYVNYGFSVGVNVLGTFPAITAPSSFPNRGIIKSLNTSGNTYLRERRGTILFDYRELLASITYNFNTTYSYLGEVRDGAFSRTLILDPPEDNTQVIPFNASPINSTITTVPFTNEELKSFDDALAKDTLELIEELKEIKMVDSVRVKEIYAILGAAEFPFVLDTEGEPENVYMSVARNVDLITKALGMNYNADGTVLEVNLNEAPEAQNG